MAEMKRSGWIALAGALALGFGSLMPWVTGPFGISVSGTSGDGVLTLIASVPLAVTAVLMARHRWAAFVATVIAGLAATMMAYEVVHISSAPLAGLGIGVLVCVGGAVAGLVGGVMGIRQRAAAPAVAQVEQLAPVAPVVSPDGRWWWDGSRWLPTESSASVA
jgi:hypothetical protein